MAGLVLTALLVPQGMAYAELAGLPAITGLYTSILCLVGYALFGPSKVLVLGRTSSLGPMIAATVPCWWRAGRPGPGRRAALALALMVGAINVVAGVARLRRRPDLQAHHRRVHANGLALTILVGQLPKLFGFSAEGDASGPSWRASCGAWPTARPAGCCWRSAWPGWL